MKKTKEKRRVIKFLRFENRPRCTKSYEKKIKRVDNSATRECERVSSEF